MKNIIKRFISFSFAVIFVCMTVLEVSAYKDFRDVPVPSWYEKSVEYCYDNGYMAGTSADYFSPNTPMTRAMIVQVLYRMDGAPETDVTVPFTDMNTVGEWAHDAIKWAYTNGIVYGITEATFVPNANVQRQQVALILYKYAEYRAKNNTCYRNTILEYEGDISKLPDRDSVGKWAVDSLKWAIGAGLISGVSKGGTTYLDPKGNATRAQFSVILKNFISITTANSHTEGTAATCTEAAICSECGESYGEPLGHTGGGATCKTKGTCDRCGESYNDTEKHEGLTYTQHTVEATCQKEGYSGDRYCIGCDRKVETGKVTAKINHTYGSWTVTKKATCTDPGTQQRSCTMCKKVDTGSIPATGHVSGDWSVAKKATCTEKGIRNRYCKYCGITTATEAIPATGHTPDNWCVTTKATCTAQGTRKRFCKICGKTLATEAIPATGHASGNWGVAKKATCTEKGVRNRYCKYCGITMESEAIPATGHASGDWIEAIKPTCTAQGTRNRYCKYCGATTASEKIAALGHSYAANGWCIRCGAGDPNPTPASPYDALVSFVKKNGEYNSANGKYTYGYYDDSSTFAAIYNQISYSASGGLTFSTLGMDYDGTTTYIYIEHDKDSSFSDIVSICKISGVEITSTGYIAKSTSATSPYVYSFSTDRPSISTSVKNLTSTMVGYTLTSLNIFMKKINPSYSAASLGYVNFK